MTRATAPAEFDFHDGEARLYAPKLKPAPLFLLADGRAAEGLDDYEILCRANARLVLATVDRRTVQRRFAGWIYSFAPHLLMMGAKHGKATQRATGRSVAGQLADMAMLANRTGLTPSEYYEFGLARFCGSAEIRNFVPQRFFYFVAVACERHRGRKFGNPPDFKDKSQFERHCRALGESCVRTVATIGDGIAYGEDGVGELGRLPDIDLFVKPRRGGQGQGTMLFRSLGNGMFRAAGGEPMTGTALVEFLLGAAQEARRSLLVQAALRSSAFVAGLAGNALATTRIITIRNESDEPEVVYACFRTAGTADSIVDNYHAGGIAFALDTDTGELGTGRCLDFGKYPVFHETHPVTGKMMRGTRLPDWTQAKALALRLHAGSPHLLLCGWDIAFTADGPCVLEANPPPGIPVVQMQKGFLGTRYCALLAMHARAWLYAESAREKA